MDLTRLGWNATFQRHFDALADDSLVPARVLSQEKNTLRLAHAAGEAIARVAGRLRAGARGALDLPAVGDFVAARAGGDGEPWTVHAVLPRASAFVRKRAGARDFGAQVVAANVDVALLVQGLDGDFSARRLERYLALAIESGAEPVVVLNKADLAEDAEARAEEARAVARGARVILASAATGRGLDEIRARLGPGRTAALVGSSGVGKSSLVNRIAGADVMPTGEVRASDHRGRHTTTRRVLVPLPDGSVLLDTPGMREVGLLASGEGVAAAFEDVTALATACRFRDCAHRAEPGCAVREALASGALDEERFASWSKLQRELAYAARKADPSLRAAERDRWKKIHQETRGQRARIKEGRKWRGEDP